MKGCLFTLAIVMLIGLIGEAFDSGDGTVVLIIVFGFLVVIAIAGVIGMAKGDDKNEAPPAAKPDPIYTSPTYTDIDEDSDDLSDDLPEDYDPRIDDEDGIEDDYDGFLDERPRSGYDVELGPKSFNSAVDLIRRAQRLCRTMSRDSKLRQATNDIANDDGNNSASGFFTALSCFYMQDVCRCYRLLDMDPEIDFTTPEGQLLYVLSSNMLNEDARNYSSFKQQMLFDDPLTSEMRDNYEESLGIYTGSGISISNSQYEDFSLAMLLTVTGFEERFMKPVRTLISDTASLIARCAGHIDEDRQHTLDTLQAQIDGDTPTPATESTTDEDVTTDLHPSLDELVGLTEVKKQVSTLRHVVEINRKREEMGMNSPVMSLHCVFTGNPGTGKTTVARIIASIYKELGVLKKGHLVETDRSGLVAEYLGQTAVKTNKIIDSALDGVLFIDEAYTLAQGTKGDYGMEAIATLLKRMEDDRDRLVVILAGYGKEIEEFIDSNPGLRSRFNRYIRFDDYSAEELHEIFVRMVAKYDYRLEPKADRLLAEKLEDAVAHKDKDFGNARFVRNMFEKTLESQAVRLANVPDTSREDLARITTADVAQSFEE